MLQIIGLLGCVYLLVKSLEISSSNAHRTESGRMNVMSVVAALIAFLGSLVFAWALIEQGAASTMPPMGY